MPERPALLLLLWLLVGALSSRPVSAEMQRFTVETAKSRVGFDAFHSLENFSASSEAPAGELEADVSDLKRPIKGQLSFPAASLRSGDKKRDRAIHRALDAPHYPEIRYRVEKVESSFSSLAEDTDVLLTIHGVLTMRGADRPVAFMGRVRLRPGGALWMRGEAWIKPLDWGIPLIRIWLIPIKDTLLGTFDLVLSKGT